MRRPVPVTATTCPWIASDVVGAYEQVRFAGPLWASEQAWRFRFGFVRKGPFNSNDVFAINDVPVPATTAPVKLQTNLNHQGFRIWGVTVQPFRDPAPLRGTVWPNAEISIRGSGIEDGWALICLELKDQAGRPLRFEAAKSLDKEWKVRFLMSEGTRNVNMRLAASRVRNFEFMAGLGNGQQE